MIKGDLIKLGELFFASHASMRDDYAVSAPEVDLLVELARKDGEVYGLGSRVAASAARSCYSRGAARDKQWHNSGNTVR